MRKIYSILILCCVLMACKRNSVDFTYLPAAPRAGQTVTFTNNSSSGEDWEWTFGDGATSQLKSPTHIYKNPGTYPVRLKVDKKNAWTAAKTITIYDTVPTFVASDTVFRIFEDYTFTANLYNPYNYDVKYDWQLSDEANAVVLDTTMQANALHLYFTRPMAQTKVALTITLSDSIFHIEKSFAVQDSTTYSILMRTAKTDYQQRIYGARADEPRPLSYRDGYLDREQDTIQLYNGYTFTLSELAKVFPGIQGFHIANRKIYYRLNGLWVAHIDGADQVQIDEAECAAMTLDMETNRIYWANEDGVWYMPFVGSDNNQFTTLPVQLNELEGVQKIAREYLDF